MSKYLETLPRYHFDRDDFCKVFGEVFTDDEIIDIDVMCGYPQNTENFLLYRWEDEFYIIHRDSGTIINWYKHLGRTNTCNKEGFTLADLVRLLNLYQADLLMDNDNNIREAAKHPEKKWEGTYKTGVKAQYEHARVIAAKLSVEIGKSVKSYYEL